ncbi:MAG: hypothetical protein M3Z23_05075 [Acidobacteriota bacterium]|nr:hypothetical protein [Acidobacteriota bacterium]
MAFPGREAWRSFDKGIDPLGGMLVLYCARVTAVRVIATEPGSAVYPNKV